MPDPHGNQVADPARFPAVVVCIGNSLVADDAAGCAVYEELAGSGAPVRARLHHLGVGGLSLLDVLEGENLLIVVDAVRLGAAPGTIHVLDWDNLPQASGQAVSAHGIGLRDAITAGRLIEHEGMPGRVMLVGIEGASFNTLGTPMTEEVRRAIPEAARIVCELIATENAGVD